MAKGCYSLGMFSKVVGNGWVVMAGLKVGGDGEILVNIDLFAHFWAKYIKLRYTSYIYLLKRFNSK
jgi:hypothetical protein